jgi:hypothetical protein
LVFRTKPDGAPLAVAIADYSGGCGVLHLSIAGHSHSRRSTCSAAAAPG